MRTSPTPQTVAAPALLLGYTPDSKLRYTITRRGYPDQEHGGFHPVCSKCDGYGTVYGYATTDAAVWPRPSWIACPCCKGGAWAPFSIILNAHLPEYQRRRS